MKTIVSGIQPSGKLHIGNYLGMLSQAVELQKEYDCFYFVADMHSLTENYNAKDKPQQILDAVIDLLAVGVDPDKSAIFIQSQVPEHAELAWYFNTLVPIASLERMTQYKDKAGRQKENINVGLFDYPVLQAADILLYKPYGVPVGEDQLQHLELTNDIVKKFNNKFGQTFPTIKPLLTNTPRVMSLLEPAKKMSKSLGEGHVINISDDAKTIEKKLARAVTDTGKDRRMSSGVANLFQLLEIFGEPQQHQFYKEAHQKGEIRYADLKANLAKVIAHHFSDYREKRTILEKRPEYIKQIITDGKEKACGQASQTLREVKEKMGLWTAT
ncbi:MAG: tryptophan--tRNA ligase [Candidatus Doudnabacteria bacterium]|nr:tryptophan--tRNA ligase [Candidatus Doudnabacteria bacterium]